MNQILEKILNTLTEQWLFDVYVFSQWWLYVPLAIPAVLYLSFFILKWVFLTLPLWIPFYMILNHKK